LFYALTDCFELLHHFQISKSDDAYALRFKRLRSPDIVPASERGEVTVAIDFNDEHLAGAIEVRDVFAQRLLSREFVRHLAKVFKPQLALGRGWIMAQCPSGTLKRASVIDEWRVGHA
jgi:hypothetical protein